MNQILHILKKDLRRYAWAWMTLAVIAGLEIYLYGTTTGLLDTPLNSTLAFLTGLIGAILFFIVIVMVVQEETLTDPEAYWLARPIGRGKLLVSKLLFLAILVGLFLLSEAIIMILNGGAARLGYVFLSLLPLLALWQAQVFLAAQTRSLPRYLLLVVCLLVGFYSLMFGFTMIAISSGLFNWSFNPGQLPADIPAHLLALIQTVFWLLIGITILSFLYLRRRVLLAWLILIPAVVLASILTPSDSFYGAGRSYNFDFPLREHLNIDHIRISGTMHTGGEEYFQCDIVFEPFDLPVAQDMWIGVTGATLTRDGREVELNTSRMSQRLRQHHDGKYYASLGHVKQSDLEGEDLRVDLTFTSQISFSEQVRVGQMNLQEGADFIRNGNRLVIRGIARRNHLLSVDLAGIIPDYLLEPSPLKAQHEAFYGQFGFALMPKRNSDAMRDFDVSKSWANIGNADKAQLEISFDTGKSLEDYEIIVFARQLKDQAWHRGRGNEIPVIRQ